MRSAIACAVTAAAALLCAAAPANAVTCSYPAAAYTGGGSASGPDPLLSHQWGLSTINAPAAWQHGYRGAGATIAIVDTGIDLSHPDLQAHLVPGADLDRGVSAASGGAGAPPGGACPGPQDENGHGTHVAGIAAAIANNGIGGAGTAPDASLMPVRVLDASGSGQAQAVLDGIHWAADHGAKVINMSLGGQAVVGELPQANQDFADAVSYAYSKGAVVVAAAGNESVPLCSYPAAAQYAVCVAAVDRRGAPSAYSNFPASPGGTVALRAPGGSGTSAIGACESDEDIWSTIWPGGDPCPAGLGGSYTGYDTLAGTSMAAPFVSGVAALLAAKGLSASQILECLQTTSTNRGGYDPVMGYGIADANAATSTCSAANTPGFQAGAAGGGNSGSAAQDLLTVRVKRTSIARLRKTRKLHVSVTSGRARKVRLGALVRRGRRRARTIGRATLTLRKAGAKSVTLKIGRRQARRLLRGKKTSVQVRYRSGPLAGVAAPY